MEKITRKVDELGRVVLPLEVRQKLGIEERNNLTLLVDSNRLILQKEKRLLPKDRLFLTAFAIVSFLFKAYRYKS